MFLEKLCSHACLQCLKSLWHKGQIVDDLWCPKWKNVFFPISKHILLPVQILTHTTFCTVAFIFPQCCLDFFMNICIFTSNKMNRCPLPKKYVVWFEENTNEMMYLKSCEILICSNWFCLPTRLLSLCVSEALFSWNYVAV